MAESLPVISHPFEILEHLGEGGYGSVDLVWHEEWGLVAHKKLTTSSMPEKYLSKLKEESRIQQGLHHPNIVTLFDAQFNPPVCGLFLENVKYGTVEKFLVDFRVSREWKLQIIYDVALAIAYLHRQKPVVIHGDLKSQNILIGSHYRAKVCDFGLAHAHKTASSQSLQSLNKAISGTVQFIAPEYLSDFHKMKNEKFDVYAYGISVWEIVSEKKAYYDCTIQQLLHIFVEKGERPKLEDIKTCVPARIANLVEQCWQQSQELRPDFKTITAILQGQIRLIQPEIKDLYANLLTQEQQHICLPGGIGNSNSEERMCTSASILNQNAPSGEVMWTEIAEPEDTEMSGNNPAAGIVESSHGSDIQIPIDHYLTQISREEMSATIAGVQTITIEQSIRNEANFTDQNISLEIAEEETGDRDPALTVELLKSIEMKDDEEVVGVTWLENKIYVVFKDTKRVCMFQGLIPYSRMKDTIEVPYMKTPYDMTSSQVSRSIFISDTDEESRCVWRIQMSNKSANQWRVDGIPKGLFLASPDKLIVLVELDRTLRSFYAIHVYQSCGVDSKSSIELPQEIYEAWHALTLKNGNFAVSYRKEDFVNLISEISADGKIFIRTFDHRSVKTIVLKKWRPIHLAVDEHDHIIVANFLNPRDGGGGVFLLNLCTEEVEILLDRENHHVVLPKGLLYMKEKRQLIVSHWLQKQQSEYRALVSVFDLFS